MKPTKHIPDQDTAFPCPAYGMKYGVAKKVNIAHVCFGSGCGESSYFFNDRGEPVAYCPLDCDGERELISGKRTRFE